MNTVSSSKTIYSLEDKIIDRSIFNAEGYKRAIQQEFRIVNKDKKEVAYNLNKAQDFLIFNLWYFNIILKARKMGFSSLLLAIGALKFLLGKNERVVSMSFDRDASSKQLERAKRFIESFERRNGIEVPKKYNNKNEMVYERIDEKTGEKFVNTFRIGTARSDSFGRGDDISFLHLTEVSLAENLEELLAGVGEATVNNAITTLETTANGFNAFKNFWDKVLMGSVPYKGFFFDPTWEYSLESVNEKRARLGRLGPQEYPMTPQEAFLTSGDSYFDIQALELYMLNKQEPIREGVVYG